MNKDLAYCVGLHQGDGCLGRNVNRRNTSKGYREYIYWYNTFGSTDLYLVDFYKKVMGINNKILLSKDMRKDSYKDYYRLSTHSRVITNFLLSLGYSENKQVDLSRLLSGIDGFEWEFLQGLLDTDGYVTLKNRNNYLEWVSDDYKLSHWVCDFVNRYVTSKLYCQKRKNVYLYSVRVSEKYFKKLFLVLFRYRPSFIGRKYIRLCTCIDCKG